MQNLNLSLNCNLNQFHFMDFYRLVDKMSARVTSFISRLLAGRNKGNYVIITDLDVSAAGVKITNFLGSVNIQHDPSWNSQCDLCILDQSAYASESKYPRFNLLRVARRCFLWFSVFLFSGFILSLSFLCLQSLKLFLL